MANLISAGRIFQVKPISVLTRPTVFHLAGRFKAWVCGRSLAEIVGSNPTRARMSVCCECCVWSDRGLCDELITRSEESYRLWCFIVCDLENS
jgi:hypothetical protein